MATWLRARAHGTWRRSRPVRSGHGRATDIAARGIQVDGIDLVIHADPPAEHKAYVHRSGRTARGGAEGTVVTAAQAAEVPHLNARGGRQPAGSHCWFRFGGTALHPGSPSQADDTGGLASPPGTGQ
jgi:helicase-like protein